MYYTTEDMITNLTQIYGEEHEYVVSFKKLCDSALGTMEQLIPITYEALINRAN